MGSRMKRSIFDEQTSKALKKWHMTVKKKHGGVKLGKSKIVSMDGSSTIGSTMQSPSPALHRFKTTGHSTRSSTFEEHDEYELSDHDMETNLILRVDEDVHHNEGEANNAHDFNFFKHTIKSLV